MPKAKPHPDQMGFCFEPPVPASLPGELGGLEPMICGAVGTILASDGRAREVIAAKMSVLLGETVSKQMLDAYSSTARSDHRVPMSRFLALIAVTERHDLLDPLLRKIGAALLVGEEVHTARIGHIRRQMDAMKAELAQLEKSAPMIRGETRK